MQTRASHPPELPASHPVGREAEGRFLLPNSLESHLLLLPEGKPKAAEAEARRYSVKLKQRRGGIHFGEARASRSLSPLRDQSKAEASTLLPKSDSGGRKWRLMKLLLFQSASEGRATGRDSRDLLRNRTLFSSFFSSNGSSSSSSTTGKRGGKEESVNGAGVRRGGLRQVASAHEKHYTASRVAAEGQRKKTPLPYQRQGLFGFIQYNPAIRSITEGFSGSSSRP